MEAQLTFSVHEDDALLVEVSGELDIATVPRLRALLESHTNRDLRLDFSGVTFIDSGAVRELMALHRACDDHGRTLVVIGLRGVARRTVLMLGLYNVLTGWPEVAPLSSPGNHRLSV